MSTRGDEDLEHLVVAVDDVRRRVGRALSSLEVALVAQVEQLRRSRRSRPLRLVRGDPSRSRSPHPGDP